MILIKLLFIQSILAAQFDTRTIIGIVTKVEKDRICIEDHGLTTCIKRTKNFEFLTSNSDKLQKIIVDKSIILEGDK